MARIHHISVPLRKSAENWALKQIRQFLESAFENCNVAQLIEELNLTTLKEKDIWKEFAKLEKLIDTANSAQVSFWVNHTLPLIVSKVCQTLDKIILKQWFSFETVTV